MCCLNFKPAQITKIISKRTLISNGKTRTSRIYGIYRGAYSFGGGGGGFTVNGNTCVFGKNSEILPIGNAAV